MRRTAVVGLSVMAALGLTGCDGGFGERCDTAGGEVRRSTSSHAGVGVGANGTVTPVITTQTTEFCVVDGNVTDIRTY